MQYVLPPWISDQAKDLIVRIFKPENERLSITEVLDHPFVKTTQNFIEQEKILSKFI